MNTRVTSNRARRRGFRSGLFVVLACTVALACMPQPGYAQCGGQWLRTTEQAGLRGQSQVNAMTAWLGDGLGNPAWLVLGGQLNQIIDGEQYYTVVGYNGAQWLAMDSLPRTVKTLTTSTDGTILYAGIDYMPGAGQPVSTVMQLHDSTQTWQPMGVLNGATHALLFFNGSFYAGGDFTLSDGQPVEHVVRWNGSSWVPLADGGTDGSVRALAVYNGKLIAAGDFANAGGSQAANIAQWSGLTWSALGSGTSGLVRSLALHGTNLVAAGHFTEAGGQNVARIAYWDGTLWSAYGNGFNNRVWTVKYVDGHLYAGGQFTASGAQPLNHVARWNSTTSLWEPLDGGTDATVSALIEYYDDIVVGGYFDHADGLPTRAVAQWDGGAWSTVDGGFRGYHYDGVVTAMETYDGKPHAGGIYTFADSGFARSLAAWNGLEWQEVTGGVTEGGSLGAVYALRTVSSGGFPSSTDLMVGGFFDRVGGEPGELYSAQAANIAEYSLNLEHPDWEALGAGLPDSAVFDITRHNNEIIAAGNYDDPFSNEIPGFVARWDGSQWWLLGDFRMNAGTASVYAVNVFNEQLYAGGTFHMVDGQPMTGVARWNGSVWQPLGTGLSAPGPLGARVAALQVYNGALIVSGTFDSAGGIPSSNIARWNGAAWSPLGAGISHSSPVFPGAARALTVYNGDLIAGGDFTHAGGQPCSNIARWDGVDWQPLGSGVGGSINDLCVSDGELYVGGLFTRAGNVAAHNWARWTDTNIPWIATQQPLGGTQARTCDDSFSAGVVVAMGYDNLTYQWRRNGIPLINGTNTSGSIISGADGPQLTITNLRGSDPGSYTVVVSNACGSDISNAVTLVVTGICVGDLNSDNQVDLSDLAIVLSNFGCSSGCDPQDGDLDGDGLVTLSDLALLLANFGTVFP